MSKILVAIAVGGILLAFPGAVPLRAVSCTDVNGCIWGTRFAPSLEISQFEISTGTKTGASFVPALSDGTAYSATTEGKGLTYVSSSALGSNLLYYTVADGLTFAGDGLIHISAGGNDIATLAAPTSTLGTLAYDPTNHILWASDWNVGNTNTFWALDPDTGAILPNSALFATFTLTQPFAGAGVDGMAWINGFLWINEGDTFGTYNEYDLLGNATGNSLSTDDGTGSGIAWADSGSEAGKAYIVTSDPGGNPILGQADLTCVVAPCIAGVPPSIGTGGGFYENIVFQGFTPAVAPELSGTILGVESAGGIFSLGMGLLGLVLVRRRSSSPRG